MFLTRLHPIIGDDYQAHQEIRNLFPGNQRVLYQRSECETIVISETQIKESERIDLSNYVTGDQWPFSIRLNPSYKSAETGKRLPIPVNDLQGWVQNKFKESGIQGRYKIIPEATRISTKKSYSIVLSSIFVVGVIEIFDEEKFKLVLQQGIGHAKGFGFGLLNIF